MHESMFRKMIPLSTLGQTSQPTRTTIYLPSSLNIQQPTKEINSALKLLDKITLYFKKEIFYEIYHSIISNKLESIQQNSYQIVINKKNLKNLYFLKHNIGLTYSHLTYLCFLTR